MSAVPFHPFDAWFHNVGLAALSSKETLLASYDMACNVIQRGIPGDFVECGVFGGAQAAMMARALLDLCKGVTTRRLHLFDTFAGMPSEAGKHDEGWNHPAGSLCCPLPDLQEHMRAWSIPEGLLVYHEGLFADTVPPFLASGAPIAILRIDGDLYESTRDALQLLPLVQPGGWVISDDFALKGARRAFDESKLYRHEGMPTYFKIHTPPRSE